MERRLLKMSEKLESKTAKLQQMLSTSIDSMNNPDNPKMKPTPGSIAAIKAFLAKTKP